MLFDDTQRILKLINHDDQYEFNRTKAGIEPVIINEFDLSDPSYNERILDLIFSDGSSIDFIAKCQCGETEGDGKIGMRCPYCKTLVSKTNLLDDNNLVCKNWLSCPADLPHGWLSPKMYLNLASWLSYDKNKRNYLDDILDVDAILPFDLRDVILGRGFTYLYENFDRIIDFFVYDHPVTRTKPEAGVIKFALKLNQDKIFCHYIPILNSAINPIIKMDSNNNNKKRYGDVTADHILSAANSLSRLKFFPKRGKRRFVEAERTAFKAFKSIIAYNEEATTKYISVKKAIPRTHLFGSRFHMSIRGVIVPITEPHFYYELHLPYKMAINTFRVQLYGALARAGYTIHQAALKVSSGLQKVDPDLLGILNNMIRDSPFPGLPFVWNRPPSIRDGSVQLKFCTMIKPDLNDKCVSISPLDHKIQNLDYDGDALAGVYIPETEMARAFMGMSPSHLIWDKNSGKVSSDIGIHKTQAMTWNHYLENC